MVIFPKVQRNYARPSQPRIAIRPWRIRVSGMPTREPTREKVLEALGRVVDPATGRSVTEAGLIQGLVLREGHVGFSVEVPPARGPQAEPLRKAAEDAVA